MFNECLYDERYDFEKIADDLDLLVFLKEHLSPKLSSYVFERLKEENCCFNYSGELISMVVSILLIEEVNEYYGLISIPISKDLADMILGFKSEGFCSFFFDNNLQTSMDWLVSEFFNEQIISNTEGVSSDFSSVSDWTDFECLESIEIETIDVPFAEYIKSEILYFDENMARYFLKVSFDYLPIEIIPAAFFDIYDRNYLFEMGVITSNEEVRT